MIRRMVAEKRREWDERPKTPVAPIVGPRNAPEPYADDWLKDFPTDTELAARAAAKANGDTR